MSMLIVVCLKSIVKSAGSMQDIDREQNTLKMLNHKNIIKLHQGIVIRNELLLIMEYADGGELVAYVEEKEGLPEIECRAIFK